MNDKLIKKEPDEIATNAIRVKAQNFHSLLNKQPDKSEVKVNTQAKNSKYIPISFLEMQMDELFFGLWKTTGFTYQVVANEIVGSIEIEYFHPVYNIWLTRTGAGAVMIQQEKGADITDISKKYKNTLTKDFPHLKAECFRNGCLSIGKAFGRDLNRDFEDQYNPIIQNKPSDLMEKKRKIIEALATYSGADKEDIKAECSMAEDSGTFDIEFANIIAKKIKVQI